MTKKYKNKAGSLVTAAQYITELLIIREAEIRRTILPHRFWLLPDYTKKYQIKIIHVNRFLKSYDPDDVVMALMSNEGKKVYGLKCPFLPRLIQEQQVIRKKQNVSTEYDITEDISTRKNTFNKQTNLRNLDD